MKMKTYHIRILQAIKEGFKNHITEGLFLENKFSNQFPLLLP